jgi:sensor histidine kinase YesM
MTTLATTAHPGMVRRMRKPDMKSRIAQMSRMADFRQAFRPRIPHVLVLGLALGLMDVLRAFSVLGNDPVPGRGLLTGLVMFGPAPIGAAVMIAAITWAERVRAPAVYRFPLMAATVVFSAFAANVVRAIVTYVFLPPAQSWDAFEWVALFLYLFWMNCATGALAAAYYEFWERAAQSAARLRGAELERQGIEQRVVESRLSVMKARIEPAFLFNSIATVQKLYRENTDNAEKLLDDLIVYLRAALPQMRGKTSSLGDEIHLAAAYLKLHDEAFEGRLQVAFDVAEGARNMQLPPMVLLPLVEDAVHRARSMPQPALSLALSVAVTDAALQVTVTDDCPFTRLDAGAEPALAAQERSLAACFGDAARLHRGSTAQGGTRITFEIPRAGGTLDPR